MYELFCDGSWVQGVGGWGFVLRTPLGSEITGKGAEPSRSINHMELRAVVEGLNLVADPGALVRAHTDSVYVIAGARRDYAHPLWRRLYDARDLYQLQIVKVKSHPDHTRAHHLAREAVFHQGELPCSSHRNTPSG